VPDRRAFANDPGDGAGPRLSISDPASAWGRAGLHSGDRIRALNGAVTSSADSIMRVMRGLRSGDTLRVEVERRGSRRTVTVVMTPFDRPVVRLVDVAGATPAQRALRERWESGLP